jgi:hypothetical protein
LKRTRGRVNALALAAYVHDARDEAREFERPRG